MGFALTSTPLFAGGTIGPAFSFSTLMTVIILGNVILGVYCGALGYIVAKSGLTTVFMARFSFGKEGSRWQGQFPSLDASLPAINWPGAISYVAASAIAYFTGNANLGIGPVYGIISAAVL
jgi:purine-cytosine permease-like protein